MILLVMASQQLDLSFWDCKGIADWNLHPPLWPHAITLSLCTKSYSFIQNRWT